MSRHLAGVGGAMLLLLALAIPRLVGHSFTTHMLVHMTMVSLVAPLLALASLRLWHLSSARAALAALLACVLEFVVVWAWHLPVPHRAAQASGVGFALEQISFLVAGYLLWGSSLAPAMRSRRCVSSAGLSGVAALLLTSMHMTLLGALLSFNDRLIYYPATGIAEVDLPLLVDQQTGGVIMLTLGGLVYLLCGLIVLGRMLRPVSGAGT